MTVRESIAAKNKLIEREIAGLGIVRFRLATVAQIEALTAGDKKKFNACLLQQTVFEADGSPVFASTDDLASIDWKTMSELVKAAAELNGLAAKETSEKNGSTPPSST